MAKTKVTFRPIRNSEDDWTVVAEHPGAHSPRAEWHAHDRSRFETDDLRRHEILETTVDPAHVGNDLDDTGGPGAPGVGDPGVAQGRGVSASRSATTSKTAAAT